ncbi:MAG: hypothetical protein D9V47_14590 [Clostridia bacterium]|nr:MAG: hypothetical protein D9V47_14590 [Clostridia bacterium]
MLKAKKAYIGGNVIVKRILLLSLVFIFSLAIASVALAKPDYLKELPADKASQSCSACHTTPPSLNAAGQAFKANGFKWPAAKAEPAKPAETKAAPAKSEASQPKPGTAQPAKPSAPAKAQPVTSSVKVQVTVAGKTTTVTGIKDSSGIKVPVRVVAAAAGATVTGWDNKAKTATVVYGGKNFTYKAKVVRNTGYIEAATLASDLGGSFDAGKLTISIAQAQPATTSQQAVPAQAEAPRRGCPACHVKAAKDYSLFAEAKSRAKDHPSVALDGKPMDEKTTVETCLQCHGAAPDGRGKAAPLSLRSIVHPAHMSSQPFTEHYRGNCFTCHEVDNQGVFNLLGQKVETNEKGVPKVAPIPGMIKPSESK